MKKEITVFRNLLRELQKIDSEFPLQYAVCLAEIALDEGLSLTALSVKTGMPLSTVSRIVGALSQQRQKGAPYGLVRVALSAAERRKKELYLTTRGRNVVTGITTTVTAALSEKRRA
jgi:DNA-binding MarR family transcriptional regulator